MEDNFKSFSKTNLGRQIANYTEYTRTGFITATAQFNGQWNIQLPVLILCLSFILYGQMPYIYTVICRNF